MEDERKCAKCGGPKVRAPGKVVRYRCESCYKLMRAEYRARPKETPTEKACKTCKLVKPVSEFSKAGSNGDGLHHDCKVCFNDYIVARKAKPKVQVAEKTCRDCGLTKSIREFNLNNNNVDGHHGACKVCNSAQMVKYAQDNEGFARTRKRNRAGKKLDASTRHLDPEWFDFVHREAEDLRRLRAKATGSAWHLDHVVSLDTGGLHCPTNWAIIPDVDNVRKGTRPDQYRRAFGVAIERIL